MSTWESEKADNIKYEENTILYAIYAREASPKIEIKRERETVNEIKTKHDRNKKWTKKDFFMILNRTWNEIQSEIEIIYKNKRISQEQSNKTE